LVRDETETKTFLHFHEIETRPRRLIFAARRDRDRDLARPRPRRFSRPSNFQPVGHNRHGPKIGGGSGCAPFLGGAASHLTQFGRCEACRHVKFHCDPSNPLATIHQRHNKTDRQTGQTQLSVAWAEAYLRTKWHLNPSSHLATTNVGQKFGGGLCPPFGRAGPPSNTMWLGPSLPPCRVSF